MDKLLVNSQPSSVKKWKAGFYIRLSLEDVENDKSSDTIKTFNKTESESISSQREILNEYILDYPDIEFCDEYVDDGYTGTNFERPSFKRLLKDIVDKKINCVIVKDLSRFGRNYSGVGNYLEEFFPLFNVRFIAIIDRCDSYLRPESVSNIIIPIKNIMNENYSRDISLKLRSALDAKKRNGKFIGTYASYGYQKDPTNHNALIVDEEVRNIVKRIFNDYLEGHSICAIAKQLNKEGIPSPAQYKKQQGIHKYVGQYGCVGWHDHSVKRILENPLYIGTLVQKYREKISYKIKKFRKIPFEDRIKCPNIVEPIIEEDIFNKVQTLLKRDTRTCFGATKIENLSGYIHCGDCRRGMSKQKSLLGNKEKYKRLGIPEQYVYYYICSTNKNCGSSICSRHTIRKDKLENAVFAFIKSCIQVAINFEEVISYINKVKQQSISTSNYEKALKAKMINKSKKENYLDGLYPDYRSGIITLEEYTRYKEQSLTELTKINEEIEELQSQIDNIKNGSSQENDFIKHFLKYKNVEELNREMVVDLIDNIWIYENNRIEIDIKYKEQYQYALAFVQANQISFDIPQSNIAVG